MEIEFQNIRRDIPPFLNSLRHSIDRPYRPISQNVPVSREQFTKTMLLIEEARVRFSSYVRYRPEPTLEEWREVRHELIHFSESFLRSPDIDPAVYDRPFRSIFSRNDREHLSPLLDLVTEHPMSVGDALIAFRDLIAQSTIKDSIQPSLEFGQLERIVPRQQIAPARFDVIGSKIILSDKAPVALKDDQKNVDAALDHIKGSGEKLIDSLQQSNCDKRVLETVRDLHDQIISNSNIVRIGLTNLACGLMCDQFKHEMPDALCAMFNSYSASISMYVAQFPDWEQFTQRAASIDLEEQEIAEIDVAAGEVIAALEAQPSLADPDVPKTIRIVREFMASPGNSARRAAFAMMRTIENLVASIVRHSVSFLNKTAEKTADKLSTAAATVLIGLLSIALVGATGIGSAASQVGAPWVKQVSEVVQKQIEKLAND